MQMDPPPFVWAVPDEKNILIWNYLIRGPPDSPYTGGEYHGVLLFPAEYPFKPPGIKMFTPSGRFQPDKKICFSMSDFHPGSWNPAWSVATILTGLLSFMLTDEMTTGSVTSTDVHKRAFAARSHSWNLQQAKFKDVFPEYATPEMRDLPNMGERARGPAAGSSSTAVATPSPLRGNPRTASTTAPVSTPALPPPTSEQVTPHSTPSNGVTRHGKPDDNPSGAGWANGWGAVIWEKWRWGVLIALAVLVSRLSSSR